MKPTKEAIVGVIEAIKERRKLDMLTWSQEQKDKNLRLIDGLNSLIGLNCIEAPDPTDLPFSRVDIVVNSDLFSVSAIELSSQLRSYTPSIWLNDQHASQGKLQLELVQLSLEEIDVIIQAVYLIGSW